MVILVNVKKLILYAIQFLIGIGIIIGIFYFIDLKSFVDAVIRTNFVYVFLAMLTYLIGTAIGMVRPLIIFKYLGKNIRFKKLFFSHFAAMLASDFTPGRAGYFIFPFLIKKDVLLESSFSATLTMQAIDFMIKLIISMFAISMIILQTKSNFAIVVSGLIGIVVVSMFILSFLFLMWSNKALILLELFKKIPFLYSIVINIQKKMNLFQNESHKLKKIFPFIILLSTIGWFVKGIEWALIGAAVGLNLPIWIYFFLQPVVTIVQFVPLTLAGLGLQESGSILIFVLLGVSAESALLFSFLSRIDILLINTIGLPTLLSKGMKILMGEKDECVNNNPSI